LGVASAPGSAWVAAVVWVGLIVKLDWVSFYFFFVLPWAKMEFCFFFYSFSLFGPLWVCFM
jgi:hypothetical protein